MPEKKGCLGVILDFFGLLPKDIEKAELPYSLRDDFLSYSELSFCKVLQQAVQGRFIVFAKVSLNDIFFVKKPDKNISYYNKISRKHVDFLLCSFETLKPAAGIELDDASHQREDRVKRDIFVEEVFSTAGLPLIRFENKRSYAIQDIKNRLDILEKEEAAGLEEKKIENTQIYASDTKPLCPKCKVPMVRRVVSKGPNMGKKFYGCPNYPKCREIVEI